MSVPLSIHYFVSNMIVIIDTYIPFRHYFSYLYPLLDTHNGIINKYIYMSEAADEGDMENGGKSYRDVPRMIDLSGGIVSFLDSLGPIPISLPPFYLRQHYLYFIKIFLKLKWCHDASSDADLEEIHLCRSHLGIIRTFTKMKVRKNEVYVSHYKVLH